MKTYQIKTDQHWKLLPSSWCLFFDFHNKLERTVARWRSCKLHWNKQYWSCTYHHNRAHFSTWPLSKVSVSWFRLCTTLRKYSLKLRKFEFEFVNFLQKYKQIIMHFQNIT